MVCYTAGVCQSWMLAEIASLLPDCNTPKPAPQCFCNTVVPAQVQLRLQTTAGATSNASNRPCNALLIHVMGKTDKLQHQKRLHYRNCTYVEIDENLRQLSNTKNLASIWVQLQRGSPCFLFIHQQKQNATSASKKRVGLHFLSQRPNTRSKNTKKLCCNAFLNHFDRSWQLFPKVFLFFSKAVQAARPKGVENSTKARKAKQRDWRKLKVRHQAQHLQNMSKSLRVLVSFNQTQSHLLLRHGQLFSLFNTAARTACQIFALFVAKKMYVPLCRGTVTLSKFANHLKKIREHLI